MQNRRKICVVTGTRAEYGLLFLLLKEIQNDISLELQLIATGMHLSPEFGLTFKEIEKDFKIDKRIEILLSSDTPVGISKSIGLAQISFAEAFEELEPDILVLLGDRFEILSAAITASIFKIPIAHIHGGEVTEGSFDEGFRHSITKMSHLHFPSTAEYKNRILQLGEQPNKVFKVGALGVENIKTLKLLNKKEFENSIKFKLNTKNILITFHPATLEKSTSKKQFQNLLDAVDTLKDTNIIFTKANSDTDGRIINHMIDEYVMTNSNKAIEFTSLGQIRYLSALQYIDAVIGNSSSGIIEAPSFKIGTINIGDRQKGRTQANSILNCDPTKNDILKSFGILYSSKFQSSLQYIKNPYNGRNSSKKILKVLKKFNLSNIQKKTFRDIL